MSTYAIKTLHSDLEQLKHCRVNKKSNYFSLAKYKEQVIDLLQRVCTVSVETMKIVEAMP